jgi:hypothetical protein
MPFQSEKQRRYLWANEPEIARDWTDTYGSGIAKALGGRIGFFRGAQADTASGQSMSPGTSASGGSRGGEGYQGVHQTGAVTQTPGRTTTPSTGGDRIIDVAQRKKRQDIRNLLAQQQAEKDYTRTGQIKPGPQLGWAGSGVGGGLGSWASQFAGSKIGGGLGSMLFGPWGMLLGSLLGRGVGKRGWQASQTDEDETLKQILMPEFMQNYLGTKKPSTIGGEGIQTIDIRDKFDRRRKDPYSSIDETINDYDYKPRVRALPQRRKFDAKDVSTWYDTHPATGESVMTPGFKKFYQGPDKLNPRRVADSYEYIDQSVPEWGTAEATQRPHTFGQEHEWDLFGNPITREDEFPSDQEIFNRRFG